MDDLESNCITFKVLLGTCLSKIDSHTSLWQYGITLL